MPSGIPLIVIVRTTSPVAIVVPSVNLSYARGSHHALVATLHSLPEFSDLSYFETIRGYDISRFCHVGKCRRKKAVADFFAQYVTLIGDDEARQCPFTKLLAVPLASAQAAFEVAQSRRRHLDFNLSAFDGHPHFLILGDGFPFAIEAHAV
jgi:hypothetical protein